MVSDFFLQYRIVFRIERVSLSLGLFFYKFIPQFFIPHLFENFPMKCFYANCTLQKTGKNCRVEGAKLLAHVLTWLIILKIPDREIIRISEFVCNDAFFYRESFFSKFQELLPTPIHVSLEVTFKQLNGIRLIVLFR